jgi:predicted  nucleic acid-binding Zn-ribbon protein
MSLQELEGLLLVQASDIKLDQLRHKRVTLPERAELEAAAREWRTQDARRAEVQAERDKVHAEEKRLDDETTSIGERAAEVDKKMYSGTVTSPRELQAMQADIEMLKRHRSDLEDEELEVMERRETLDAELAQIDQQIAELRATVERLSAAIATSEAEIDAELAAETETRAGLAGPINDGLLRDYEKRREQNKGAGAARLVGTTCQACHLTIPSTEAERIRRAEGNEVAYCDNCSAILVP